MSSTFPHLATLPPLLCSSCDLPSSLPLHSLSLIMAYPSLPPFFRMHKYERRRASPPPFPSLFGGEER